MPLLSVWSYHRAAVFSCRPLGEGEGAKKGQKQLGMKLEEGRRREKGGSHALKEEGDSADFRFLFFFPRRKLQRWFLNRPLLPISKEPLSGNCYFFFNE